MSKYTPGTAADKTEIFNLPGHPLLDITLMAVDDVSKAIKQHFGVE